MFDWIGDLFSRLWKAFKRILPYILIACAIWLTMGLAIPLFAGLVIEGTVLNALLFVGASFLFAPEETIMALQPAIEAIGDTAQTAAHEVGEATGSLLGAVSDSLGLPTIAVGVGLAVLAYFLLKSKKDEDGKTEAEDIQVGTLQEVDIREELNHA